MTSSEISTSVSKTSSSTASSSSSAGATGLAAFDLRGGGGVVSSFKNCTAKPGAMCAIRGGSSFSGLGSSSVEYVAVSNPKKAAINIYAWGKSMPHIQCHIQEIATSICSDVHGAYLFAGCKSGQMVCWDLRTGEILKSWVAHYTSISRVEVSNCSSFVVSTSEDGTVKVWDLHSIVDLFLATVHISNNTTKAFRSYSAHTMPIKGMALVGSHASTRVVTCSLDMKILIYDVYADTICLKAAFSSSLESVICNCTEDTIFAGASNGKILIVDLTERAIALTAAHSQIVSLGTDGVGAISASMSSLEKKKGYMSLEGHTRAVTALAVSIDNTTLVSASLDCSIRVWDTITRQCLRESKPFNKSPLSNVSVFVSSDFFPLICCSLVFVDLFYGTMILKK